MDVPSASRSRPDRRAASVNASSSVTPSTRTIVRTMLRLFTGRVVPAPGVGQRKHMDSFQEFNVPPPGDPATLRLLTAALAAAPAGAVFSGKTAAWLHGLEIDPCHPIEMIVPTNPAPRLSPRAARQHRLRRRTCRKGA